MGKLKVAGAGLIAGLAACSGGEANNSTNGAANQIVQEGDLNMAIGGDELSPIPQAEDDLAANLSNQGNGAGAANQAAPANGAAPAAPR